MHDPLALRRILPLDGIAQFHIVRQFVCRCPKMIHGRNIRVRLLDGVETGDAIPLVRPAYSAGTTTHFYLGGSAIYQRPNSPWLFLGFARHMWLDGDIEDSPITGDDKQFTIGLGLAIPIESFELAVEGHPRSVAEDF